MLEGARCTRNYGALLQGWLTTLDGSFAFIFYSRNLSLLGFSHITQPGELRSKDGMLRMLGEASLPYFNHATSNIKTNIIFFLKLIVANNFVFMHFVDISTPWGTLCYATTPKPPPEPPPGTPRGRHQAYDHRLVTLYNPAKESCQYLQTPANAS